MKKILSLIIVMIAFSIPSIAEDRNKDSNSKNITLRYHGTNNRDKTHRAPMRIPIEAYYDEASRTINVCYNGDNTDGEVYLYLNENIVGYDSEINTTFQISTPGLYSIEIVTESWIADGEIQL